LTHLSGLCQPYHTVIWCGCYSCASHSCLSLFAQSLSLCRKPFQVICCTID